MRTLLFILAVVFLCLSAGATTRYVAQTAGTFTGGVACNGQTAITPATFNGLTLSPGDITYVCGTITMPANTEALIISQSGTSGNPITILFDSGAVMSSPAWPPDGTGGAIDITGGNFITINGNGGTGGNTQGIIEATANGDAGATCLSGPCTLHQDSNGVEAAGGNSNIIIEGLSIIDMYIAIDPEGGSTNPGGNGCFYVHGTINNWTVTGNLFHDMGWCMQFKYDGGSSSNITISNNQVYNIDHGIVLGGSSSGTPLSNVFVYGNYIHDYSNWDTTADTWHHDGIHIWGFNNNASDPISNVYIYNNQFGGCIGNNVTAHIFVEQNAGGTTNVNIFNNTLIDTCAGQDNDGLLTTGVDGGYKIYNNAILCNNASNNDKGMGTSSSPNVTFINNVVSGCTQELMYMGGGSALAGGLHNNIYANGNGNCASSGNNCFQYGGSGIFGLFSTWQSTTGQDASPSQYVSSANLNSSGVPQSGSATIGNGANLTSLCTGSLAPLCSDLTGATRPSSGAWTIGAYNFGSTPPPPTTINGTVTITGSTLISNAGGTAPIFFSYAGGNLTITTSIGGDSLFYTTDGSAPNIASTLYSAPFAVSSGVTINAIAANVPLHYQNTQYTNTNWKCGSPSGGTFNGITCPATGGVTGQPSTWNWTFPGSGSASPMFETLSCTLSSGECQLLFIFGNNATQCDTCTVLAEDKIIQPDGGATNIANNELDSYYYDSTHNRELMGGLQCTQIGGTQDWEYDTADGSGWRHTGVTAGCPVPSTSQTHVAAVWTRDFGVGCGGNGCMTLQSLYINGTQYPLADSGGQALNPGGFKALGLQDQIDSQNTVTCGTSPCEAGRDVWANNVSLGFPTDASATYTVP